MPWAPETEQPSDEVPPNMAFALRRLPAKSRGSLPTFRETLRVTYLYPCGHLAAQHMQLRSRLAQFHEWRGMLRGAASIHSGRSRVQSRGSCRAWHHDQSTTLARELCALPLRRHGS